MNDNPRAALREQAEFAFQRGVQAADPKRATSAAIHAHFDPNQVAGDLYILAFGKAAVGMAQAALEALGPFEPRRVLAITNYENDTQRDGIEILAAAHPVPDAKGAEAALCAEDMLRDAKDGDVILALVSGGASALLPAPIDGVSLADKIKVNELLLGSGLDIGSMNIVRQSLSRTKGGGLLATAAPARVISFVLSDVLGDDMRLVGSGPTLSRAGTSDDAREVLQSAGVWKQCPSSVQDALLTPKPLEGQPEPEARLIGSNGMSLSAMAAALNADVSQSPLEGDVQKAAERVVGEALSLPAGKALAFGGETTVVLKGSGRGGRNQELALRVAQEAERQGMPGSWVFLSGGTDGRDGPTDAAGGVVDDQTLARLAEQGLSLSDFLDQNDSYKALEASGDLLITGATGTNVADLQIFLRAE